MTIPQGFSKEIQQWVSFAHITWSIRIYHQDLKMMQGGKAQVVAMLGLEVRLGLGLEVMLELGVRLIVRAIVL